MNAGQARARRLPREVVGNAVVLLGLLALTVALLPLHDDAWWPAMPRDLRWIEAAIAVAFYAAFCGWILRRSRPRIPGVATSERPQLLIAWASQTGFAQQIAERTAETLSGAGMEVSMRELAQIDAATLATTGRALFIVSTTGESDPPDPALVFVRDVLATQAALPTLQFAVLALGDREYDHFCAFGHRLDQWLRQSGASPLFDLIEVDNGDAGALRHWQHHLGLLAQAPELPDWSPVAYESWRLCERSELNPGSAGEPAFHIALAPVPAAQATWQAGDIAEIGPRNAAPAVDALLERIALPADARVQLDGKSGTLGELLALSHLPAHEDVRDLDAQALANVLKPLPHREYSIASMPQDGTLQLLVRRMRRPDGRSGLGSGWLCEHAAIGGEIDLRIRRNANFHPPAPTVPMVLVGNGTGIAGLRAHLKARVAVGARRNWLLFGERNRDRDFFHRDEIERWHADGFIERIDTVFSRDGGQRRYVQDALGDAGGALQDWVVDGAAIYVCGSLQGMAPGVDAVLREVLGEAQVERMLAEGRYRRDVY